MFQSMRSRARSRVFGVLVIALSGCAGGAQAIPQGNNKVPNASGGQALGNAVVAGVLWAAGGGCRLQGCPYGSYCSFDSGFCQTRKCSEGCPDNTVCNEGLDRCQAPGPAKIPNDFQPTDNRLTTPPTMH